ncbi:ORF MSV096 hypothetical protein [Melanoplus sanguinipes entomopoxvirus]|uniref:Uncharacterized protein n=1 Tax=Melanoplus sanguinipes entomopoxvirus TaxID=83191 RepID=Q9YVZ6_MSEPV|nr:ORF MSV096 hypothetical protein [Melanoplus sanguinipes entomopoxvirus]AAC97645.1 ORF MSV096 hypothetical protein [Melanoplus sanguinipes entomopoxvirus 'O']
MGGEYLIVNQCKNKVNYIEDRNQLIDNTELDSYILNELLEYKLDKIKIVDNEDNCNAVIINIPSHEEKFNDMYIKKIIKNRHIILIINKDINSNIEKVIRYHSKDIPIFTLKNNIYCLNIFNRIMENNNKPIIDSVYIMHYNESENSYENF